MAPSAALSLSVHVGISRRSRVIGCYRAIVQGYVGIYRIHRGYKRLQAIRGHIGLCWTYR